MAQAHNRRFRQDSYLVEDTKTREKKGSRRERREEPLILEEEDFFSPVPSIKTSEPRISLPLFPIDDIEISDDVDIEISDVDDVDVEISDVESSSSEEEPSPPRNKYVYNDPSRSQSKPHIPSEIPRISRAIRGERLATSAEDIRKREVRDLASMVKNDIVSKITDKREYIDFAISEDAMKIWIQCFTSPLNSKINYDPLETEGDAYEKSFMVTYIRENFPDVNSDRITSLIQHYASNEFHAETMKKIPTRSGRKIHDYMLSGVYSKEELVKNLPDDYIGDIYEAIFGAIITVFNMYKSKLGPIFADKWFEYIASIINFNVNEEYKSNYIAELSQIFDKLATAVGARTMQYVSAHETSVTYEDYDGNRSVAISVYRSLTREAIDLIERVNSEVGIELRIKGNIRSLLGRPLILRGHVNDTVPKHSKYYKSYSVIMKVDKKARNLAAKQALDYLKGYGITQEWASQIKMEVIVNKLNPHIRKDFMDAINSLGYVDFVLSKDNKYATLGGNMYVSLLGVKKNGFKELIFTKFGKSGTIQLSTELITNFVIQWRNLPPEKRKNFDQSDIVSGMK